MTELECKCALANEKTEVKSLDGESLQTLCDIFRMLGEPSRMKILMALMEGEACVYHIVKKCGGQQSAVSHQLRILKDNKIVKARRDGQNILYSFADGHVEELIKIGLTHVNCKNE